jgi:hypothetical protein
MAVFDEEVKSRVVSLIRSTSNAEVVEVGGDRIRFRGKSPRRTFEIICEDAQGYRVKETTGFQTAGRSGGPAPHSDRDVITESKMIGWLTSQLNELGVA